MKQWFTLLKATVKEWSADKASVWSASLSYYTIFSLSPLLLVLISLLGLFFGEAATKGHVYDGLKGLIGQNGASTIEQMISSSRKPSTNIIATIIGVITLILGAGGVFGQLKEALNNIWKVKPKPKAGIAKMFKDRFLSFSMVLVIGFLLAVSLVATAAVSVIGTFLGGILPFSTIFIEILNFVLSLGVITVLFALIYKILPDVQIPWKSVWVGALFTGFLFVIGKTLIGLYIGHSSITSSYGASGSLVIILLWVYYSAQILFLGAEFTKVYAYKNNRVIRPSAMAVYDTESKQKVVKKETTLQTIFQYLVAGFMVGALRKLSGSEMPKAPGLLRRILTDLEKIGNYKQETPKLH